MSSVPFLTFRIWRPPTVFVPKSTPLPAAPVSAEMTSTLPPPHPLEKESHGAGTGLGGGGGIGIAEDALALLQSLRTVDSSVPGLLKQSPGPHSPPMLLLHYKLK